MKNFSFPKKFIINKNNDYKKIFSNKLNIKIIKLHYIKFIYNYNEKNNFRLGIILNKKKVKKSCTRNLFKRIIREFFRLNKKKINNFDIIIMSNLFILNINKNLLYKDMNIIIKYLIRDNNL